MRKNIEARKNMFRPKGLRCGLLFECNWRLPRFARAQSVGAAGETSAIGTVKQLEGDCICS